MLADRRRLGQGPCLCLRLRLVPALAVATLAAGWAVTTPSVHAGDARDAAPATSPPAPRAAATLATREMILVNQVGFARGTSRWRARELYRLLQNPVEAADVAPGDRARAISGGVAALQRELHEHRVLTDELSHVRADSAALERPAPVATGPVSPPSLSSYLAPVGGGIETPFGAARDAVTGVWIFRAGVRLRARTGEMVRAPQEGTVRRVFETALAGRAVVLSHADGQITILEGLGELSVAPGQAVRRGETIAAVPPASSRASPTISLEIWRGLAPVDPSTVVGAR